MCGKALEESGVIQGYRASVDPVCVGLPDNVSVGLASQDQADLDAFEDAVRQVTEVMECYRMTGDFDYLLPRRSPRRSAPRGREPSAQEASVRERPRSPRWDRALQ